MLGVAGLLKHLTKLLKDRKNTDQQCDFDAQNLFSKVEADFYRELRSGLPEEFTVFAKVRLADLVGVRSGQSKSQSQAGFNRISLKHVDFVICRNHDLSVALVVELDDRSHLRADRRARDEFVDKVLAQCGMPVIHVSTANRRTDEIIKQLLTDQSSLAA